MPKSNQTSQFNEGKETSNTIDRQFTPEFVSKTLVEMPARQTIFLDRGNRDHQPENHGDTFTMEVRYPVYHKDNVIDGGIDGDGALFLGNQWKAYNAAGELLGTFNADDYMVNGAMEYAEAVAAAKAAALNVTDMATVTSGAGEIRNGKNSYLVNKGALIPIPETGGQMNEVGGSSKMVSAKVDTFGLNSKYTVKSVKLDSRVKLIGRTIQDLGRARKEAQEGQARASVYAAAESNRMCASSTGVCPAELDGADRLTYAVLEQWQMEIENAEIPLESTIVTGVSKIDTKTVTDAFIVYIPKEVKASLRRMVGPDGTTLAFISKEKYAAGLKASGQDLLDGEFGMIDGLTFRFVEVQDALVYRGQGEEVGGSNDSTDSADQAIAYKTNGYYDVFPLIVVGEDSYTTLSYGWGNVQSEHVKPKRDLTNDIYATRGGIVTQWSYGFLCYRPERIRSLVCTALKGKA